MGRRIMKATLFSIAALGGLLVLSPGGLPEPQPVPAPAERIEAAVAHAEAEADAAAYPYGRDD
jgi:hypothetical protein